MTMMTCREVATAIASEAYAEAAWPRRLAMRLHLAMCRHCRRYAAQIRAIGEHARALFRAGPEDAAVVERLERAILEALTGRRG